MGNGKGQSARPAARQVSKQATQHPGHPRRTPRFPSPMATIHDLPLEIIGRIITIAYSAAPANWVARKERYRFLKATSLVCREWTPFAHEELWLEVSLYREEMESFLEAGAGRHATLRLSVDCSGTWENLVEAVLRDVRGVRELKLSNCTVSMDRLYGNNFKDVKTLHLFHVAESAASTSNLLPFDLTKLKLRFQKDPSSFPLIGALSRQSSITSLVIDTDQFDPTALLTRLAPLAPGLVTLDLRVQDALGAADDFLKGCTHLKHLNIYNAPLNTVKHVAASLASWTIPSIHDAEQLSTLLDVLETGSIAIATLEKLVLGYCSVRTAPRWVELVKMCKDKKIKLIQGDREGNSETIA